MVVFVFKKSCQSASQADERVFLFLRSHFSAPFRGREVKMRPEERCNRRLVAHSFQGRGVWERESKFTKGQREEKH